LGPSPRYFWMSSLPTTRKKVALVLLATALASSVLPVPGSPYRMTPCGSVNHVFVFVTCNAACQRSALCHSRTMAHRTLPGRIHAHQQVA
jgi:hypothetical protein